jgi:3-hydroxyacyl-CoA dehydrogenase
MARVGVIGCGLMGSGIAEVCARAGLDVIVREVDDAAAELETGRVMLKLPPTWGSATEIPGTKVTSAAPSCLTKAARPPTQ